MTIFGSRCTPERLLKGTKGADAALSDPTICYEIVDEDGVLSTGACVGACVVGAETAVSLEGYGAKEQDLNLGRTPMDDLRTAEELGL